ncbi:MAG: hypothetical protein UW73_C0003G0064 [Microgenomates group bacterium GW2011_GWB1_44_8]|nr:MAG: hypothetical protein UW73_C0003G0064 [Microgenomates group bacterium GW2011_GWB1_44_8]
MKQAAIYDPYLDTLGGGERYTLSVAVALKAMGFGVDVLWSDKNVLVKSQERFQIDLSGIKIKNDFFKGKALVRKIYSMSKYDLIFFVSDGSVPFLTAKVNWLHFQVPFVGVGGKSLINTLKFKGIGRVVVNSLFTKQIIDKEYGLQTDVLYPPVDTQLIKPLRKEKIILSVGRFSKLLQVKGHDFLINNFKELVDDGLKGWTLMLAGGLGGIKQTDLTQLQKSAEGYPIKFTFAPNFSQLKELYGKSTIYWTASGYGQDENTHPERVEHFGITLVEAMAAGCLVLPVRKGGFKEILGAKFLEYGWDSSQELKARTKELIMRPPALNLVDGSRLRQRALEFSFMKFKINVRKRVNEDFSK